MEWNVITLLEGHLLGASSLLAINDSRAIVIDTGLANQRNSLIGALMTQGLVPDDISLVLNTHLHVDHSNNNYLFRNARIIASQRNYEWTLSLQAKLDVMDEHNLNEILEFYPEILSEGISPRLASKFIQIERRLWQTGNIGDHEKYDWLETTKLPEGITAVPTPGHVPHHCSYVIDGTDHRVLIAGDALIVRGGDDSKVMTFPPQKRSIFEISKESVLSFAGEIIPGHDQRFLNLAVNERASSALSL